jgi:hypothetical protein
VHQGEDTELRGRFGLPPEQPARRAVLPPLHAFILLASAGLMAWLLVAGGSTDSARDAPPDRANPARAPEVSAPSVSSVDAPPTEEEALSVFRSLDRLRTTGTEAGADRVVAPGLSIRGLEKMVPTGGRTRQLEVLSLEENRIRIRQVIELPSWDVDLAASDLAVSRTARRLGVEWTLARVERGWRISGWQVVEDRAIIRHRERSALRKGRVGDREPSDAGFHRFRSPALWSVSMRSTWDGNKNQ